MDWFKRAKLIFDVPKPSSFGNPLHCCECFEYDETLRTHNIDSIGRDQLGNPGWDPMTYSSVDGAMYYMPALIKLTLDTMDNPQEMYIDQMLFTLNRDGAGNELITACNTEQRIFIADFLDYLIGHYDSEVESRIFCSTQVLKAHEIWLSAI